MRPDIEDLLTIRDGEPIDAMTAEICTAPEHEQEIERLRRMRKALCNLPEVAPPGGVWERVVATERATRFHGPRRLQLAGGAAVAAAVAVAAIVYVGTSEPERPAPRVTVPVSVGPEQLVQTSVRASYASLVDESARLERVLGEIPYQRPLMSGATAGTIVVLEDRIAFVDAQLTYGAARGLRDPQRRALWGERVELMNALVQVRLAQSQRTGF
jgi:hypothetical protein